MTKKLHSTIGARTTREDDSGDSPCFLSKPKPSVREILEDYEDYSNYSDNYSHEKLIEEPAIPADCGIRFIDAEDYFEDLHLFDEGSKLASSTKIFAGLTESKAKFVPTFDSIRKLDKLAEKNPNCADFYNTLSDRLFIHVNTAQTAPFTFLPILLVGEAGVGKSYAAQTAAKTLQLHTGKISLSHSTEAFVLSGLPRGYTDCIPGEVAVKLSESNVINPVIIADELDKASFTNSGRPSITGPLLTLLENETANQFEDSCLRMSIDASHVSWIATANSLESIPEPILSRFQVFDIGPLSKNAMHGIIETLAKATIDDHGLTGEIDISIDLDVKDIDSSIRAIKKALLIVVPKKYRQKPSADNMHITASDLLPYVSESSFTIGFHRH